MARKSTADQRREMVSKQRSNDPILTQENYRNDLLNYTNHHNKNTESKVIRKWALDYQGTLDKKLAPVLNKASDYELRSIGVMGYAVMRGDWVCPDHITRIKKDMGALLAKYTEVVVDKSAAPIAVAAPVVDKSSIHIAEVNGAIDEWVTAGTAFSMKDYVASKNLSGPVAKTVGAFFNRLVAELAEAVEGKDPQLKEAYAFMGKVKLRKFHAFVEQIIMDCQQQVVSAKTQRKPRARKEKPAAVLVSKLKYMKEHTESKLKSDDPKNIVGASQVWLYDVDRRKLSCYNAVKGQTLTVKGTAIMNWDVATSSAKTLRKPELVINNLAKRTINSSYEAVSTKAQAVNGRTNDNTVILKAF